MKVVFAVLALGAGATVARAAQCKATVTVSPTGAVNVQPQSVQVPGDATGVLVDLSQCSGGFKLTWAGANGSRFAVVFNDVTQPSTPKVSTPCSNGFAFVSGFLSQKTCKIPSTTQKGLYKYTATGSSGAVDPKVVVSGTGIIDEHRKR